MSTANLTNQPSWPRRLALATALCTLPLFLFGGSVTTLGAGMAVQGWLDAEGHFVLFFPVDKWTRDTGTFVEHTHRLFGALVGLLAIATLVAALVAKLDRRRVLFALVGLLAVVGQGVLGGLRVLEDDRGLAFLHGALGQAVFALLFAVALVLSPRWAQAAASSAYAGAAALRRWSLVATLLVWLQITSGAWYRHGLRATLAGEPLPAAVGGRLHLHLSGALFVFIALYLLWKQLRRASRATELAEPTRTLFLKRSKALMHVLSLQVVLGLIAWGAHQPGPPTTLEWTITLVHLVTGALLLTLCFTTWLWSSRLSHAPATGSGLR